MTTRIIAFLVGDPYKPSFPTGHIQGIPVFTAQGGGGSFKNRKPIGEIGCCDYGIFSWESEGISPEPPPIRKTRPQIPIWVYPSPTIQDVFFLSVTLYPKTPWDVMGCQVATCLEALFGVSLGGSGVSIGGVGSLRVYHILVFVHRFCLRIITKKTHDSNIGNLSFSTARSLCNGDER